MKNNSHQSNWIVDASTFTGFWMAAMLDLTGLAVHQWLGLAVGILVMYHILVHWTWIKSITQRWTGHTSAQARRFYLIDAGLLAGFSLILLTGLVISTWLGLTLANYTTWYTLHVMATLITLGFVVVKIGAHWRWIVNVGRKMFHPDPLPAKRPLAVQPVPSPVNRERRDFLKLMGVVSVAALIAAYSALENDNSADAQSSLNNSQPTSSLVSSESNNTSSLSTVCCNRGCSYPGHCRRCVDSNSNGRCDLGEYQT